MSAIEPLLHALLGDPTLEVRGSHCDLRSAERVLVRLASDACDERVMLISSPCILDLGHTLASEPSRWRHTLDHPDFPEVRCTVLLQTASGRVELVDWWVRGAVLSDRFAALVENHVQRHRHWEAAADSGLSADEDILVDEEGGGARSD